VVEPASSLDFISAHCCVGVLNCTDHGGSHLMSKKQDRKVKVGDDVQYLQSYAKCIAVHDFYFTIELCDPPRKVINLSRVPQIPPPAFRTEIDKEHELRNAG
jgi:hypothetical protein